MINYFRKLRNNLTGSAKDAWLVLNNPKVLRACVIKSHLTIPEKVALYCLAKDRERILEVGSYIGASASCFGAALKQFGRGKIFCIDTWNNDAMTEGHRDTYIKFTKNVAAYSKYIIPVRGYSTEVVREVACQVSQIDLLFIDGDHSYTGVKADWESYKSFLRPGSVVVFHDWGWAAGVKRVIEEDVKPLVFRWESLPNMWWGTIGP